MTQRKALVRQSDGEVQNVIVADDSFDPGDGLDLIDAEGEPVSPGDVWDGEQFISTDQPDPEPTLQDRLETLEEAAGVGGRTPEKGIASRLDEIEERLADLESQG